MRKSLVQQLRHVDGTPKVLNELEKTTVGAVRHLYEVLEHAAREVERLQAENRALRKLCKQHGLDVRAVKS
jgi:hypothetical protein